MTELEHFSFVLPDELAAMAYPHAPSALDELRALGFRSLVSLSRRAPPQRAVGALLHLHCPLADFTRLPAIDLHRAVVFLERAPWPAVIHGEGGIGRTGVALACRLVWLGRSAAAAVAEVRHARPGSIDDPELEASVADYARFLHELPGAVESQAAPRAGVVAAPFNFAPASSLDRIVHGAERPGASDVWSATQARSHDGAPTSAASADPALDAWLGFMARQGVREVVCLLSEEKLATCGTAVLKRYRRAFLRVTHLPGGDDAVPSAEAVSEAIAALRKAEAADAPALVHCDRGVRWTGIVLAAWLRARHGLGVDEAAEAARAHARYFGASRDPLGAGDAARRLLARTPKF